MWMKSLWMFHYVKATSLKNSVIVLGNPGIAPDATAPSLTVIVLFCLGLNSIILCLYTSIFVFPPAVA